MQASALLMRARLFLGTGWINDANSGLKETLAIEECYVIGKGEDIAQYQEINGDKQS